MYKNKTNFAISIIVFSVIVFSVFLYICSTVESKFITPKVIDGFSSPESVIADTVGKYFFVSNVGKKLEPTAKDGDGFISKLSSDGNILDKKYLPQSGVLNAPKGMAIINQTLFVTDVDRIVGFDLLTRQQKFEIDFSTEKIHFLNDLTSIDNKTLLVSATDVGKIYKIFLDGKNSFSIFADNISGANGLYFDKKTQKLFVATFGEGNKNNGEIGVLSLRDKKPKYQKLTASIAGLDGISLLSDSKLLFSDWVAFDKPGLLRVYDLKTNELSDINLSEEVYGPADFFYDEKSSNVWLPRMLEGKILIENIKYLN